MHASQTAAALYSSPTTSPEDDTSTTLVITGNAGRVLAVPGKGLYIGAAEIIPGRVFNLYADAEDMSVQDLLRNRQVEKAGEYKNSFNAMVHALNNSRDMGVEKIKDRPHDDPETSYESALIARLGELAPREMSGRFIPTLEMLAGLNQNQDFVQRDNLFAATQGNLSHYFHVRSNGTYVSCTEEPQYMDDTASRQRVLGVRMNEGQPLIMHKRGAEGRLRLMRAECVV